MAMTDVPQVPTDSASADALASMLAHDRECAADDAGRLDAEARALLESGYELEQLAIVSAPGRPAHVAPRWAIPFVA